MRYLIGTIIIILLAVGLYFTLIRPAPAPKEKMIRIGVIANPPALDPALEGFRTEMEKLGYKNGKNINYLIVPVGKNLDETKKKVGELLESGTDILYALGVLAARSAKEVTAEKNPDLPIVFGVVSNPVAGGLVQNLRSSGNNLTGVTPANELIVAKRLELFLETAPGVKRIIFPWNDPNTTGVENLQEAAKNLKVALLDKQVATPLEFEQFLDTFAFQKNDGFFRATDSVSAQVMQKIITLTLQKKIPLAGTNANDAEKGALMSYGADYFKIGAQAARLVHKILQGSRPVDLPVEIAEKFELVVNLDTADKIGVALTTELLTKVDKILKKRGN